MTVHCLSRFHLLRALGSGAAGDVFQAEDLRLGRHVAVKILRAPLCHDLHALEQMKHAAETVAALGHPNICAVEEVDEREGLHFIVMELLEGKSLRDVLADGPTDTELLLRVGGRVADALQAAHARGLVHGNIRPAKIVLTPRGDVKVLDFGVAHIRGQGAWRARDNADALAYASPEELLGRPVDPRADLFSLGVVLYEMATGRRPFAGPARKELADDILHCTPVRASHLAPGLPAALDWSIHHCLVKRPELRYQSAADLLADLQRIGAGRT